MINVTSDPSGACSPANRPADPIEYNITNGKLWGCKAHVWTLITGAGGGGSVTSVALSATPGTVGGSPITTSGTLTYSFTAANVVSLFTGCSGTQYLGADGACHSASSGGGIGASFDGGGAVLSTGLVAYVTTTGACTLSTGYYISGVDTGTVSFDVWKIAGTGTANPTVSDTILTGGYLALSTGGRLIQSSSALFTTTTVNDHDTIAIEIQAVASATKASIVLPCS